MSHCREALDAIDDELMGLRQRTVWDENDVYEIEEAREKVPDGHFANLFAIVGVKNWEDEDVANRRFKGRVVLGGHRLVTATGDWAVYQDIGSSPSTMQACRCGLAAAK